MQHQQINCPMTVSYLIACYVRRAPSGGSRLNMGLLPSRPTLGPTNIHARSHQGHQPIKPPIYLPMAHALPMQRHPCNWIIRNYLYELDAISLPRDYYLYPPQLHQYIPYPFVDSFAIYGLSLPHETLSILSPCQKIRSFTCASFYREHYATKPRPTSEIKCQDGGKPWGCARGIMQVYT